MFTSDFSKKIGSVGLIEAILIIGTWKYTILKSKIDFKKLLLERSNTICQIIETQIESKLYFLGATGL